MRIVALAWAASFICCCAAAPSDSASSARGSDSGGPAGAGSGAPVVDVVGANPDASAPAMVASSQSTVSGPKQVSRVSQCNRLIEVINAEQGPLKKATGNDPAALQRLADRLDSVATHVKAVELADKPLVSYRDDYARMAIELGKASRDTAAAVASNDPKKVQAAAEHMSSFGDRESSLVDNINSYCSELD